MEQSTLSFEISKMASLDTVEKYLSLWKTEGPKEQQRNRVKNAIIHFLKPTKQTSKLILRGSFTVLPNIFHVKLLSDRVKKIDLRHCLQLVELPDTVCDLDHLETLDLSGCCHLTKLPDNIEQLKALNKLNLFGCTLLGSSYAIEKSLRLPENTFLQDRTRTCKILQNDATSIVYGLPLGKPTQENTCFCKQPRRTLQESQKGSTCWYYVFNFLRQRVGKTPCEAHQTRRNIEESISAARKAIKAWEEPLAWSWQMENNEEMMYWAKRIDRTNLDTWIKNKTLFKKEVSNRLSKTDGSENIIASQLYSCLKAFKWAVDLTSFYAFLNWKLDVGIMKVQYRYLNRMHPGYKRIVERMEKRLKRSDFSQRSIRVGDTFLSEVAKQYGLAYSHWLPGAGVLGLIKELKTVGPLAIYGRFGGVYYQNPPLLSAEDMKGRDVFFWNADATRVESACLHVVLLVGASQREEGNFVYFIDPNDSSDPEDIRSQPLYRISFEFFCATIQPVGPVHLDKEIEPRAFFRPYAFCAGNAGSN